MALSHRVLVNCPQLHGDLGRRFGSQGRVPRLSNCRRESVQLEELQVRLFRSLGAENGNETQKIRPEHEWPASLQ